MRKKLFSALAGFAAGAINGLLGAGGGMVLVPILSYNSDLEEKEIFTSSIVIILPICLISLLASSNGVLPWAKAFPYMLGAIPGGILAGIFGKRIPTHWLHRTLGVLILYGGIRYIC